MSQLTTIINKFKLSLSAFDGNAEVAKDYPMFHDSLNGLRSYQEANADFSEEEKKEADELYEKYKQYLIQE